MQNPTFLEPLTRWQQCSTVSAWQSAALHISMTIRGFYRSR